MLCEWFISSFIHFKDSFISECDSFKGIVRLKIGFVWKSDSLENIWTTGINFNYFEWYPVTLAYKPPNKQVMHGNGVMKRGKLWRLKLALKGSSLKKNGLWGSFYVLTIVKY